MSDDLEARVAALEKQLARSQAEIERLTVLDDVTGLPNRRGFFTLAEQELRLVRRQGVRAEIAVIDVEGLDVIVETQGEDAGANAIAEAAQVLQANFRESDVIGRVADSEFAVFIVNPAIDTSVLRKRLDRDVAAHNAVADRAYQLSLSIGFLDSWDADDIAGLLAKADEALYYEKVSRQEPL